MFSRSPVQRRRAVLAVLLAVCLILLTVYFSEPVTGGLHAIQRGAGEVLSPLEEGAARAFKPFSDLAGWVGDVVDAKKQNKQLKAEVKNLHGQLAVLATDKAEADQLRSIMQVSANIPKNSRLARGQVVVTSGFKSGGLQSLFPRGIPIGKVGAVNLDQLQVYQRVRVQPYAELRNMDFVQVITNNGTSSQVSAVGRP